MKKYNSLIVLILIFTSILALAYQAKPIKSVELRYLVVPTDSGLSYRDTSVLIDVLSPSSISINGTVYSGLSREVTPSPEDDMIYDLYSNKDESFNVCFDLDPDNGDIKQVVMYHKQEYYCFR